MSKNRDLGEFPAGALGIDASGNVGIGTNSPVDNLNIYDSDNNVGLHLQTATTGTTGNDGLRVGVNDSYGFLWQFESLPLAFATAGTERMRIDSSGNVGIGTSSPVLKLSVDGDIWQGNQAGAEIGRLQNEAGWYDFKGSTNVLGVQMSHVSNVRLNTNSQERMRIDSSGNATLTADSTYAWATTVQNGTGTNAHGLYVNAQSSSGVPFRVDSNGSERMGIDSAGRISMPHKAVISGRMGSAMIDPVGPIQLKFNFFYTDAGGISYDSSNGRFTVPVAGKYRVTMNPFKKTGTEYPNCRVLIGKNNSTPTVTSHHGHCYSSGTVYNTLCLNSVIAMEAGDFIVFYLSLGSLYNKASDQFNDFSIEMIA